ncbi:MarR family winged helix-turn-helix transcriptional regulator [Actibacterium sp. D379-3]
MEPPKFDNLIYVLFDLVRLFRAEIERGVGEAGLGITPAEARILAALRRYGPMQQQALAAKLGIARMSATEFIDRLETAGLIRRQPDPADRRAKLVDLTEAAKPMLAALDVIGGATRQAARGAVSDADWQTFNTIAETARHNLLDLRNRDACPAIGKPKQP